MSFRLLILLLYTNNRQNTIRTYVYTIQESAETLPIKLESVYVFDTFSCN